MKRAFDVAASVAAMVVLSPVLVVIAVAVAFSMGRPVLFRQERAGLHGQPFTLIKFRTMNEARGTDGELLPDADRLTRFGSLLRSTSLDELPELWNVLRGDMSLVGPRPLPVAYLERYPEHHALRHNVRPGITGWAQVNGRNTTHWADRLDMDVWYVGHQSPRLDLRIIASTLPTVLSRRGVSADGHATMSEYRG
jgi:lipopolysaccharide/colanic/teichoic acid biosynthesis glycosyltransferase